MAEQTEIARDKPHLDSGLVGRIAQRLGENGALREVRRAGLKAYAHADLPDRVKHLWRYTDPTNLLPDLSLGDRRLWPSVFPVPAVKATAPDAAVIRLRAGEQPAVDLTAQARASGIEVAPLGASAPERVGSVVPASHGIFEALNTAIWSAGVQIRIPAGVRLDGTIRMVSDCAALLNTPRVLVVLEEHASAVVLEEHTGGEQGRSVIGVSEVLVGDGAELHYVLRARMHAQVTAHLTLHAHVERDGRVRLMPITQGTSCTKVDVGSTLRGPGASSEVSGLAVVGGRQHVDHHTVQHHQAARTRSRVRFKTALSGRAHSAYTGNIRIEVPATDCEAYQENRNLLLSSRSRADSIPELEILNQDVQCTHGATVSPVDEDHVFYMMSRGIPRAEATGLIVRGFMEEILGAMPEVQRAEVEQALLDQMALEAAGERGD